MVQLRWPRRQPPLPVKAHQYVYFMSGGSIGPAIDLNTVKSTGSPLLDRFMGIGHGDEDDLPDGDVGYMKAYSASPTMYRCIDLRATTLAAIPRRIVNQQDEEVGHPLGPLLGPGNTRLFDETERDMQVFGRAFWSFGKRSDGRAWIRRLNPSTIEVIMTREGIQGFKQTLDGIEVASWPPHELVYFSSYNPGADLGYVSPTSRALVSIGVTLNIALFSSAFFKNGAMPDGILTSENRMLESDRQRILADWRRQFQGVENAHGTALLDGGTVTYQPITPPIKDLAMTELRGAEYDDIARAFGVPPTLAMVDEAANFAVADSERKSLYTETVLPELDLLLDTINQQLIPRYGVVGVRVEAVTSDIAALQEDRTEITQRATGGVTAGYLSLNDARKLEQQDPLETDYMLIGGKLAPRVLVERADLEALKAWGVVPSPQPSLPSFGFASLPSGVPHPPASDGDGVEPFIIDQPQKTVVDIVVRGPNEDHTARVAKTVLADTMQRDLTRWRRKIASKGHRTPFEPDYLPPALSGFLRAAVFAWDGATDQETWIDHAFDDALRAVQSVVKQTDDLATPEEFEAYWRGIDELFIQVGETFEDQFADVQRQLVDQLRAGGDTFDVEVFLAGTVQAMVEALTGTLDDPGPVMQVYLAGAARGNDLYRDARPGKAALEIDWNLINQDALAWAEQFSSQLVRGINETTLDIFKTKFAEWIASGGTLEDFADFIEGIPDLEISPGWVPGKMKWTTSRERARLIAQTVTTKVFTEGNFRRWEQLGVQQVQWRTQNDAHVDDEICRPLNNVLGTIADGWVHPRTGVTYRIPAHPGCRCFPRPVV